MKPITFQCEATLRFAATDITRRILDLTKWPDFRGYFPIPGILSASFDLQTPNIVGTRIHVINLDGSSHVEEIVEWQPEQRVRLEMKEFSRPLSRWAIKFEESWKLDVVEGGTLVIRSFRLHARSAFGWMILNVIAFFLKRAISRHLRELHSRP